MGSRRSCFFDDGFLKRLCSWFFVCVCEDLLKKDINFIKCNVCFAIRVSCKNHHRSDTNLFDGWIVKYWFTHFMRLLYLLHIFFQYHRSQVIFNRKSVRYCDLFRRVLHWSVEIKARKNQNWRFKTESSASFHKFRFCGTAKKKHSKRRNAWKNIEKPDWFKFCERCDETPVDRQKSMFVYLWQMFCVIHFNIFEWNTSKWLNCRVFFCLFYHAICFTLKYFILNNPINECLFWFYRFLLRKNHGCCNRSLVRKKIQFVKKCGKTRSYANTNRSYVG